MGSHELNNNHRAIQAAQGIDPDTPEATRAREIAMFGAQETGQPLDFTRPLELVCDGTEVVREAGDGTGYIFLVRADGKDFTDQQHPFGTQDGMWINETGTHFMSPTGPQIVRNRAEANTPVQADALVEMIQADRDAAADLLGEAATGNGATLMLNITAHAFAKHRLAHQPTTDAEAEPVAWMYHHPGDLEHGWQRFEFKRRIQTYEGMSCNEEDAGMVETPLYAHPPANKARIVELEAALKAIDAACTLRSLRGRQHVPSMRAEQDALQQVRAALENRSSKQEDQT